MTLEFGSDVRSPGPNLTKFPVLFPDSRETVFGDGFARDCLLSQPVRVSRYSPAHAVKRRRFPPSRTQNRTGDGPWRRRTGANGRVVSIRDLAVRFGVGSVSGGPAAASVPPTRSEGLRS